MKAVIRCGSSPAGEESIATFTLVADGQQELISMIQLGLASGRTENQLAMFRVGGGQTNWYLIIANEL